MAMRNNFEQGTKQTSSRSLLFREMLQFTVNTARRHSEVRGRPSVQLFNLPVSCRCSTLPSVTWLNASAFVSAVGVFTSAEVIGGCVADVRPPSLRRWPVLFETSLPELCAEWVIYSSNCRQCTVCDRWHGTTLLEHTLFEVSKFKHLIFHHSSCNLRRGSSLTVAVLSRKCWGEAFTDEI